MEFSIAISLKTFVLGEYLALQGGPALRGRLLGVGGGGGDERAFVLVEQIVELARDGLAGFLRVGGLQDFRGGHEVQFGGRLSPDAPRKNLSSLP